MFSPPDDSKTEIIAAFICDQTRGLFSDDEGSSTVAATVFCCTEFFFFAPRFYRGAQCADDNIEYMRDTVEGCLSSIVEFRKGLTTMWNPPIAADRSHVAMIEDDVVEAVSRWMAAALEPNADQDARLWAVFGILQAVLRFYASVFEVSFRGDRPSEPASSPRE